MIAETPCLYLPKIPGSAVRETHGLLAADLGILGGQTRVFFLGVEVAASARRGTT